MSAERSPQPNDNSDTWYVNEQGRRVHRTTLAGKRIRIIYPKDDFDLGAIPKWEAPESGRLVDKDLQEAYVDIGRAIVKSEMERLVDTFTMALDHDLISAEDFGTPG
jgi:hypothetical protein